MQPIQHYLDRDQEHFVNVLPEKLDHFVGSHAVHREIHTKYPEGFTLFWNRDKGDWRVRGEHEKTMGWYFSDSEIVKPFYLADPKMRLIVEKSLLIDDMVVTRENMEEFFNNVRKLLA